MLRTISDCCHYGCTRFSLTNIRIFHTNHRIPPAINVGSTVVQQWTSSCIHVLLAFALVRRIKINKNVSPPSTHKTQNCGEPLCPRGSVLDLQGFNFKSCVWRAVSSHSSHHPQEVLLAQLSLYVHKSGLKTDSSHFFVLVRSLDIGLLQNGVPCLKFTKRVVLKKYILFSFVALIMYSVTTTNLWA